MSFPLTPPRVSCDLAYPPLHFVFPIALLHSASHWSATLSSERAKPFKNFPLVSLLMPSSWRSTAPLWSAWTWLTVSSTIMVPWLSLRSMPGTRRRWDQAFQSVVAPSSSTDHRVNVQEVTAELSGVGGSLSIPFRAWVASRCWRVRSEGRGPGRKPQMDAIRQHARPGAPIVF